MGLVSQTIETLTGGVSQQAQSLRAPSQVNELVNCLPHPVYGLLKRPPVQVVAKLSGVLGAASAFLHNVARSADDRYRVVIVDGDVRVYDETTGAPQTVLFPKGKGYLASSDPARDFRAVTVDDSTFIVNRSVIVKRGTAKSPSAKNEALVAIRQADFSTFYQVTLDSTNVQIITNDGSSTHDRRDISTERIATQLREAIIADAALSAFVVTQYGSTLHIARTDGADFSISAADGLSDEGILAIKGGVQKFEDLPIRARKGFTVEITGDPTNQFDNYYVTYDDNGAPNLAGVWRETVRPATLTTLDETTMPYQLTRRGSVLDGVEAKGIPGPPTVESDTATKYYAGWTKGADPGYGAHDPKVQVVLNEEQEAFSSVLTSLNGDAANVRVLYDIDTRNMISGSQCTVELYVSNAPSTGNVPTSAMTKVLSKTYNQGVTLYNEAFELNGNWPQNTQIEMMLRYGDAKTPDNTLKRAAVRLHTKSDDENCSIVITVSTAKRVTFATDAVYPAGTLLTATVNAAPSTRTSTSDEDGVAVALALKTMLEGAGCTVTVMADGALRVAKGTVAPALTVALALDGTNRLYNPDMGLVPNDLVGKLLTNESDGSTGTIVSNTETQILVGGLTGGVANVFTKGDLCEVTGADTTFSFQPVKWAPRSAGDLDTNPDPSFVGRKIDTVFFHRNRLGMASVECAILSRAGDYTNFFRQTVTALLPDDVIDVKAASDTLSYFHAATHWNGELILWADKGQYLLSGEPALSPQTVSLPRIAEFANAPNVLPLALGRRMAFVRAKNGCTQLWEMAVANQTGTADAQDTTAGVPRYLLGNPLLLAGDAAEGLLAIVCDADRSTVYVQNFQYDNGGKTQEAWHRWTFAGATILSLTVTDGRLDMVTQLGDGVYLETMNLAIGPTDAPGSFVDHDGSSFAGTFLSHADLSTIYLRTPQYGRAPRVETDGRLTIRYLTVRQTNSRDFTVGVTVGGLSAWTGFSDPAGTADSGLRVPVMHRNTDFSYSITSSSADGFRIVGVDWEGTFNIRSKRL